MDLTEVMTRVTKIEEAAHENDDEGAHEQEDHLHRDFIRYVAERGSQELAEDLAVMAREILRTDDIDFMRWYA